MVRNSTAVSYTHLDVYKRQHEGCPDFCCSRRPAPPRRKRIIKLTKKTRIHGRSCEIRKVFSTFAVSYTHLFFKQDATPDSLKNTIAYYATQYMVSMAMNLSLIHISLSYFTRISVLFYQHIRVTTPDFSTQP